MKKLFTLLLATLVITTLGMAQSTFTAEIKGTKADLEASLTKGVVNFDVLDVKGQNDVDLMNNRAVPYKKEIVVTIVLQKSKAQVSAMLNDGAKDMKWLFRFFLNAGINSVQFEGKTISTQEFFQPWL